MSKNVKLKEEKAKNAKLSFNEAIKRSISTFPERAQNVLVFRYGLDGSGEKTLEEIGKSLNITRERVRQIVQELIKKMKSHRRHPHIEEVVGRVAFTIKDKNGIIEEVELVSTLSEGKKHEAAAIKLITDTFEDFIKLEMKGEIKRSVTLADFSVSEWKKLKSFAHEIFSRESKPLPGSHLAEKISLICKDHPEKKIHDWLSVSEEISKGKFGKWGLAAWPEINPKNTREKAYIILKESNRPLHFTEIAVLIDEHGLNRRRTHRQTVHNELIKDSRFVLVGRGVYALAEWGYKQGTVKDIIKDVLREAKKPLTRDEIIHAVMKMRQVKKSTVLINLNTFFEKTGKSEYALKAR